MKTSYGEFFYISIETLAELAQDAANPCLEGEWDEEDEDGRDLSRRDS